MRELLPLTPDRVADLVGACAPCTFWQTVPRNGHAEPREPRELLAGLGRDGDGGLGSPGARRLRRRRAGRPCAHRAGAARAPVGGLRDRAVRPVDAHAPHGDDAAGPGRPWPAQGTRPDGGQGRPAPPVAVARGRGRASARRLETRLRARCGLPREGRFPCRTRPPGIPTAPDGAAHGGDAARRGGGGAGTGAGARAGDAAGAGDPPQRLQPRSRHPSRTDRATEPAGLGKTPGRRSALRQPTELSADTCCARMVSRWRRRSSRRSTPVREVSASPR